MRVDEATPRGMAAHPTDLTEFASACKGRMENVHHLPISPGAAYGRRGQEGGRWHHGDDPRKGYPGVGLREEKNGEGCGRAYPGPTAEELAETGG